MTKTDILNEIIGIQENAASDMVDIVKRSLNPLIAFLFEQAECPEKTDEALQKVSEELIPVVRDAQRQAYDEIYTEEELSNLLAFMRANPWHTKKNMVAHQRIQELSSDRGQAVMKQVLDPMLPEDMRG